MASDETKLPNSIFLDVEEMLLDGIDYKAIYLHCYEQGRADAWRWIPVNERLPEVGERVLVYEAKSRGKCVAWIEDYQDISGSVSYQFVDDLGEVNYNETMDGPTHWLPIQLPGDPK